MKQVYSIFKLVLITLLLCQNTVAYAASIKGKHYSEVEDKFAEESLGVEKFFSLTCKPCWKLSMILPSISEQSQLPIYKTHVIFDATTRSAATLYYSAAVQLKEVPDSFMRELFLLTQASAPITGSSVADLFLRYQLNPISQLTADQQAQVNKQLARSERLTAQAQIMQIPSIIINGQYQINMRPHKSISELSETIKYLAELES